MQERLVIVKATLFAQETDGICHQLQAMAVLKRDIDRERAFIAKTEKPKLSDSAHIETIVLSSDEEDDILTIKRDSIGDGADANGVIVIDSDSEADAKGAPTVTQRNSAPQGISLSALQTSPPVVDLTAMVDEPLASPSTHGQDALSHSPKKRGSVSLRLDLSSDALRGVPFTDAQLPSPVTLAPRTARPLSAHPLLAGGVGHFFPDPANTDPNLLPHLLTTIATQSHAQGDIIGAAGPSTDSHMLDLPVQPAPSTHLDSMMSLSGMEDSHRMDLDLFGEIVDDDDSEGAMAQGDSAIAGDTQELQRLLSQPSEAPGLNISLSMDDTMSQIPTDAMSVGTSQHAPQPSDSFTTNSSTISEPSQPNSLPTELSTRPEQRPGEQHQQQPETFAQPASDADQLMAQASQMGPSEAGTQPAAEGTGPSSTPQPPGKPSAMSLVSTFSEFDLPNLDDVAGMNLDHMTLDFLAAGVGDGSSMDLTNFGDLDLTAMLNSFDNPNPNTSGESQ